MAGNVSIVNTGSVSIGVTEEEKYKLYRAAGYSYGQSMELLAKRDGLSMPCPMHEPVINAADPGQASIVTRPDGSTEVYSQTDYPKRVL